MILCIALKKWSQSQAFTKFSVILLWLPNLSFVLCLTKEAYSHGGLQKGKLGQKTFLLNQLSQICCHTTIQKEIFILFLFSRYVPWIRSTVDYLEIDHTPRETERSRQDPESAKDDQEEPESEDKLNENGPCSSNPCGANTNCWNSGERFMCTCNQDKPHGNPYFGCSDCVYDTHCNPK